VFIELIDVNDRKKTTPIFNKATIKNNTTQYTKINKNDYSNPASAATDESSFYSPTTDYTITQTAQTVTHQFIACRVVLNSSLS